MFERNQGNIQNQQFNEIECRQKIFTASRSGNLQLLQKMLGQIESVRDQERSKFNQISKISFFVVFKRRDPEGKFVINNVLMNGHAHMLEYLLENWMEAHSNLPLTLEGNTSVLHQAMCKAAFVKPQSKTEL